MTLEELRKLAKYQRTREGFVNYIQLPADALAKLIKVAEAAKAAAEEINLFYSKMSQSSHVQSIAEEDHDLWFHRDAIQKCLDELEST